jgi:polysaccharide biosynthesis protein PslJ
VTGATLERPPRVDARAPERRISMALPAWPLYALIAGFPVAWAVGASAFVAPLIAGVMVTLMLLRRRVQLIPGILPWFAFSAWVIAAAITLDSVLQTVGYLQRLADILSVGIVLLYYVNARERLTADGVIRALVVLWVSIVVLGLIATQFPEVRLTTPVGLLLPEAIRDNDLVYQLVSPRMAEVQRPWGAAEPFNRPAAPFPYANSWGAAYTILTPVVFAFLARRPRRIVRVALVVLLLVSLYPAVETSNRGMFLGLGLSILYVVGRLALRGRLLPALGAAVAMLIAGVFLVVSGAAAGILGRQQYSNSTGTRADVYAETIRLTFESPLVGWATPKADPTIGIALGTQGHAWTYMFSYGFVGLALFCLFLWGGILRTSGAPSMARLWLHSVPVTVAATMWFYGLGTIQLIVVALILALLLRGRYQGEREW